MAFGACTLRLATPTEALRFYPPVARRTAGGLLLQVLNSTLIGFDVAGEALAVAGLFEHPHDVAGLDHLFELWFVCRPEARDIVGAGLRAFRLTLARTGQDRRCRIFVLVRQGDRDGARLARGLGMRLRSTIDGLETWSVDHGGHAG